MKAKFPISPLHLDLKSVQKKLKMLPSKQSNAELTTFGKEYLSPKVQQSFELGLYLLFKDLVVGHSLDIYTPKLNEVV
jgi:hypothetical protein